MLPVLSNAKTTSTFDEVAEAAKLRRISSVFALLNAEGGAGATYGAAAGAGAGDDAASVVIISYGSIEQRLGAASLPLLVDSFEHGSIGAADFNLLSAMGGGAGASGTLMSRCNVDSFLMPHSGRDLESTRGLPA